SKLFPGLKFTVTRYYPLHLKQGDHEANQVCGVIAAFRQNGRSQARPLHRNHDSERPPTLSPAPPIFTEPSLPEMSSPIAGISEGMSSSAASGFRFASHTNAPGRVTSRIPSPKISDGTIASSAGIPRLASANIRTPSRRPQPPAEIGIMENN